jgi:AMP-binding enzyme
MHAFELDAAALERLADDEVAALRRDGLREGDSIGWLGLNHPRALALLSACERLGLRYVPLNWRLAAPELAALARHAGLQRLLHDEAMGDLARQVIAQAGLPLPRAGDHQAGDLMLVYTSGTTGEPKGAIHTAASMRANVEIAIDAQRLDAATRTLAVLPLFRPVHPGAADAGGRRPRAAACALRRSGMAARRGELARHHQPAGPGDDARADRAPGVARRRPVVARLRQQRLADRAACADRCLPRARRAGVPGLRFHRDRPGDDRAAARGGR